MNLFLVALPSSLFGMSKEFWIGIIVIAVLVLLVLSTFVTILSIKSKRRRRLADNAGATNKEKRKSNTGKVLEEKENLKNCTKSATYLKQLSKDYPNITVKIDEIIDKLKYANPSKDEEVLKIDKKIQNEIEDAKIALSRQHIHEEDVIDLINEIIRLIAERESLI